MGPAFGTVVQWVQMEEGLDTVLASEGNGVSVALSSGTNWLQCCLQSWQWVTVKKSCRRGCCWSQCMVRVQMWFSWFGKFFPLLPTAQAWRAVPPGQCEDLVGLDLTFSVTSAKQSA